MTMQSQLSHLTQLTHSQQNDELKQCVESQVFSI